MPGFPKIAKSTILGKNSGGRGSHFWGRAGIPQSLPTRLEESQGVIVTKEKKEKSL